MSKKPLSTSPSRASKTRGGDSLSLRQKHARARYDAAQTTPDNARHWAASDSFSADAALSADVRKTLRNRARYEVVNNTYAMGIVQTLANYSVGTGPRLQMLMESYALKRRIENEFMSWANQVHLAEKLRTIRIARCQDGEAFIVLTTNPKLTGSVKLDLNLIEADQVTDPEFTVSPNSVDGIFFDDFGNPVKYRMLKNHPGANNIYSLDRDYIDVPAEAVIHVFRKDRPGQHRGVPELTSAVPLFAQLRRYTLATLSAAEQIANQALVLKTSNQSNDDNSPPSVTPMETIELERNMVTVLPEGYDIGQPDAKQPTTTYTEFKHEILNEIARCQSIPYNIAAGNSSGYNYASGRLDHQTFFKTIAVDQVFTESLILDRILRAWLREFSLSDSLARFSNLENSHKWFWDGVYHVDPAKEATAQEKRLENNTTTLAREYGLQGQDWEEELEQRAKELKKMADLGITPKQASPKKSKKAKKEDDE